MKIEITETFDFREKIIELMKEHKVTQREISSELGMQFQNFNRFIKGKTGLPYKKIDIIIRFFAGKSK